MKFRVDVWLRTHPLLVDGALACLVGLLALAEVASLLTGGGFVRAVVMLPVLLLLCAPILLRRRNPALSFVLIMLAGLGQLLVLATPIAVDVAIPMSVYAVAAYGRQVWVQRLGLAVGLVGSLAGMLRWYSPGRDKQSLVFGFLLLATIVTLAWVSGYYRRTRRLYVQELEERATQLETEREQRETLAAQRERARIAREMHDVVAHSLSVMVLQADGGAYAATSSPEAAARALTTIGDTGRQALTEMRRLLGVLREGETAELAPQPGLARVEELAQTLRLSGHPTTLTVHGAPTAGAGVDTTAYRIVQESVTNVLKHAGSAAAVDITISYGPGVIELAVLDDGRGAAALGTGSGNGVRGMHERAALYDGTVHTGPRPGGGFAVQAILRTDESATVRLMAR